MRAWLAPVLCLVAGWAGAQPPSLAQADDAWNRLRQQGEAAALAPLLAEDRLLTHSDGRMQHKADDLQALATRPRRPPHRQRGRADTPVRRHRGGHRHQRAGRGQRRPAMGRALARHARVGVARWPRAEGRLAFVAPGADRALKVGAKAGQNSSPCGEAFFGGVGATKQLQSSHGHCSREALKPRRLLASAKRRDSSCA